MNYQYKILFLSYGPYGSIKMGSVTRYDRMKPLEVTVSDCLVVGHRDWIPNLYICILLI
jgi:hypothetical protein